MYVLFPILPFSIITSVSGIAPFAPVHPLNMYPSFVGFINVIFSLSTVYASGFVPSNIPSFRLYVIAYSSISHTAYNVNSLFSLYSGRTEASSPTMYSASVASAVVAQPLNIYPFLVGSVLLNSKSSSSIFSWGSGAFSPPFASYVIAYLSLLSIVISTFFVSTYGLLVVIVTNIVSIKLISAPSFGTAFIITSCDLLLPPLITPFAASSIVIS